MIPARYGAVNYLFCEWIHPIADIVHKYGEILGIVTINVDTEETLLVSLVDNLIHFFAIDIEIKNIINGHDTDAVRLVRSFIDGFIDGVILDPFHCAILSRKPIPGTQCVAAIAGDTKEISAIVGDILGNAKDNAVTI